MKRLSIIIILANILTFGQINPGAKQISMSNSDVALSNDVFSIFNNSAGLSQINWREIGIYYSPAPFGLTELANGYIAYIEPSPYGSFSFGAMTYGFELYRESKLLLSYSNHYQKMFFYGLTFNFHSLNIKNYGNDFSLYLNIGSLVYLQKNLRFGFTIDNINRASFSDEKGQIPTLLRTGFSYDVIPEMSINISLEKDIRHKPSFQFGIDYDIIDYFSLRTGYANNPSKYSVGIGINYLMFNLDYAMFSHIDLGLTHQFGLIINFNSILNRKKAIRDFLGVKE